MFHQWQIKSSIRTYINKTIEKKVKRYFPNARVQIASHHLCHAYSSVFSCDYNEGSFITLIMQDQFYLIQQDKYLPVRIIHLDILIRRKNIFKYHAGTPQTNNLGNYYWMWAYHIYVNKIGKDIQLTDPKYRETFCGKVMGLSAYGNIKEFKKDWRTHLKAYHKSHLSLFLVVILTMVIFHQRIRQSNFSIILRMECLSG